MYFIIILILVIAIVLLEKIIDNNKFENNNNNYKENYYKKQKLLTDSEIIFYKALKEAIKDKNIIINNQVVLYEIIKTRKNKKFNNYFNKIKSKSIDYVLTDEQFNILLCIELDDNSHNKKQRIKRDIFINKLFNDLEIKLIRITAQRYYNIERIEKIIKESL